MSRLHLLKLSPMYHSLNIPLLSILSLPLYRSVFSNTHWIINSVSTAVKTDNAAGNENMKMKYETVV